MSLGQTCAAEGGSIGLFLVASVVISGEPYLQLPQGMVLGSPQEWESTRSPPYGSHEEPAPTAETQT